jgi:hypothetical protein
MELEGDHLTLGDLILPYQTECLRESVYVAVSPRTPRQKGRHPLKIELRPIRDVDLGRKVDAFNNLYQVEERWNSALDQIEEQVFRRICQFLALDLEIGTPITSSDQVRQKLDLLMAFIDRDNVGKDPFAFMLVWRLKSYIDELNQQRKDAPIFKELETWAKEHGARLKQLMERAKQIHKRVPGNNL